MDLLGYCFDVVGLLFDEVLEWENKGSSVQVSVFPVWAHFL